MTDRREHDYLIVVGGTAGCILAARLTEDPAVNVLLLEAGGSDRSWKVRMPSAYDYLFKNPKFNWCYQGEPELALGGRRLYWPRGKVLGGSSSIDGLGFIRGHPLDFERRAADGASGWSYREVLPYFRRSESWGGGANDHRGGDGPVRVMTPECREPLYAVFLEAGRAAGHGISEDLNGALPEGFGAFQTNIDRGVRASSAPAYLRATAGRPNLAVELGAQVSRLRLQGNRADGVDFMQDGSGRQARAVREVILAGGAFNSPQLLMRSGIGPADDLCRHGIDVAIDLPGVGENLQDHPCVHMKYECTEPLSITRYPRPDRMAIAGMPWFELHRGPAAGNNLETMALLRSDSSEPQPDIEIQHLAVIFDHADGIDTKGHGFTCCRREVAFQAPYDRYRKCALDPGPDLRSTAEIDDYLRRATVNDFHPVGTCRMGHDRMAVVDPTLKVHGIEGLRVVDASVMPTIVGANTNATTIMIGEKAADMIRGLPPLPAATMPLPGQAAASH